MNQLQQNILEELGVDQLPPDRQSEILSAITELLLKRLTMKVLENLSAEQQTEFETVCASKDNDRVMNFFKENVPDYENLIETEIGEFRQDMKEVVDSLLV